MNHRPSRRVTALVDTGTHYPVVSSLFAAKLKKVKTAWEGPDFRTAGGHLITLTGTCTARVTIDTQTYSVSFVVLQQCSRDVILGMDFLDQHGAVIDLKSSSTTLSTDNAMPSECNVAYHASNVTDEQVTVPPLSSVIISVGTQAPTNLQSVIESDQHLLLDRQVCVARGI